MTVDTKHGLRILYVSGALASLGDHSSRFLRTCIKRGYQTYLVSYHPDPISPSVRELEGVHIVHHPPRLLKQWQRMVYTNRIGRFRRLLAQICPAVIVSENTWNNSYLVSAARAHPHIAIPMGSDILVTPYRYSLARYFNGVALRGADVIAPDCLEVKRRIITEYRVPERKIALFYWGVDDSVFCPSQDRPWRARLGWEDAVVWIMNRHFEPVYGIDLFLEALPAVVQRYPQIRVLLVGDGSLRDQVDRRIRDRGLGSVVHRTGRVSREEMVALLRSADLYVSSSRSDGTSVSLLEAMACGLPVVCTDVPAILEWVQDGVNGFIAPCEDPEGLAQCILRSMALRDLWPVMGKRNLAIVRDRGSWNANFDRMEEIFAKLARPSGLSPSAMFDGSQARSGMDSRTRTLEPDTT